MSTDEPWYGPDRRTHTDRRNQADAIPSFVEQAAANAAQRVAAINRRRIVMQTFFVAVAVSAAICIPVVLITNHDRAETSRSNAHFNCGQGVKYATIISDFVESDARLRFRQRHYAQRAKVIQGFNKIIPPGLVRRLLRDSDRLDREITRYWRHNIVPRLNALAAVNCDAKIQ